jgi:hypothetical protein
MLPLVSSVAYIFSFDLQVPLFETVLAGRVKVCFCWFGLGSIITNLSVLKNRHPLHLLLTWALLLQLKGTVCMLPVNSDYPFI